jgi:hypothetical protein
VGFGRGKSRLPLALLPLAASVILLGCGAKEHANDPRPPVPTDVGVTINAKRVSVDPAAINFSGPSTAQISSSTPVNVVFTIANQTDTDRKLTIQGPVKSSSGVVVANGNARYQLDLDTGDYLLSAVGGPAAISTRFSVGPKRRTSDSNLSIP